MKKTHSKKQQLGNPLAISSADSSVAGKIPTWLWVIGGAATLFTIYKVYSGISSAFGTIGEAVGLKDTEDDTAVKNYQNTDNFLKAFNPTFNTTLKQHRMRISKERVKQLAKVLENAFGFFNDNEGIIIGVFKNFISLDEVSYFTQTYLEMYQKDLAYTLRASLSSTEFLQIITYIKTLPDVASR